MWFKSILPASFYFFNMAIRTLAMTVAATLPLDGHCCSTNGLLSYFAEAFSRGLAYFLASVQSKSSLILSPTFHSPLTPLCSSVRDSHLICS